MAVLIDTSILVAAERRNVRLDELLNPLEQYAVSVVCAAELLHGVHRASGERAIHRAAFVEWVLASLPSVPVDLSVARIYAQASATLARDGVRVDANDLWIGATAMAKGYAVLALDGDFDRIPGVIRAPLP